MMNECWETDLVAGKNGVLSLLQYAKESHAATPPPQGLAWVDIVKGDLSTLPKDGEEYLFDSDGYETGCPMWGRIAYNGKLPSLKTLDSSGEDEYHDIWEFSRWLTSAAPQTDAVDGNDFTLWVVVNRWEYVTERHEWVNDYIGELKGVSVKYKKLVEIFKQQNK